LGFSEVIFLILYPLLNLYFWRKPPWHSLKNILFLATEPFVGTGADPWFSSKTTPTIPNYWPFRQHLRSICSLTQSIYEGVVGQGCLQPRGILSGSNTGTTNH
jgi:hypothetical protein